LVTMYHRQYTHTGQTRVWDVLDETEEKIKELELD
jgi:hypothetical protein